MKQKFAITKPNIKSKKAYEHAKKLMFIGFFMSPAISGIWWRRGELNPRPKTLPRRYLRVQFVF